MVTLTTLRMHLLSVMDIAATSNSFIDPPTLLLPFMIVKLHYNIES